MKLNVSFSPLRTLIVNFPSILDTVPVFGADFGTILTPGKASPFSSTTFPFTVMFCAKTELNAVSKQRVNIQILTFIILSRLIIVFPMHHATTCLVSMAARLF